MKKARDESRYGRGHEDGLAPLRPLDPATADSVDALVRAMGDTAFGGRRIGEAADVLEAMVRDESCFRVVTISGAMTIAKQGLAAVRDDRARLGRRHRDDRCPHDPRPLRGRGHAPLQAPSADMKDEELYTAGLQPGLRHDRAREEPRRRRAHPPGTPSTDLPERDGALEPDHLRATRNRSSQRSAHRAGPSSRVPVQRRGPHLRSGLHRF